MFVLLLCFFYIWIIDGWIAPKISITTTRMALSMSYGDPDGGTEWDTRRLLQRSTKALDKVLYPYTDDIPGITFPSVVEWAPWMDTVWFGNIYEYRTAYFQDVMYSNHRPGREGALLFKDPASAYQMAMLYQRYKKFDESSYSLPNATFYNIFGEESVRIGRYKLPQTNELLLSVMDPMTKTDMKRYFNSFAPLKWLQSRALQHRRKRQQRVLMDGARTGYVHSEERFLREATAFIEGFHQRPDSEDSESVVRRVPMLPLESFRAQQLEVVSGLEYELLAAPMGVANSQYFIEVLMQSMIDVLSTKPYEHSMQSIVVGGDGRSLNAFAAATIEQVAKGNGVTSVRHAEGGCMSPGAAKAVLGARDDIDTAICLTASSLKGGLRGWFGVNVFIRRDGGDAKPLDGSFWSEVKQMMVLADSSVSDDLYSDIIGPPSLTNNQEQVDNILNQRYRFVSMNFAGDGNCPTPLASRPSLDTIAPYVKNLQSRYDFAALRTFIKSRGLEVALVPTQAKCQAYLRPVAEMLGLDILSDTVSPLDDIVYDVGDVRSREDIEVMFDLPVRSITAVMRGIEKELNLNRKRIEDDKQSQLEEEARKERELLGLPEPKSNNDNGINLTSSSKSDGTGSENMKQFEVGARQNRRKENGNGVDGTVLQAPESSPALSKGERAQNKKKEKESASSEVPRIKKYASWSIGFVIGASGETCQVYYRGGRTTSHDMPRLLERIGLNSNVDGIEIVLGCLEFLATNSVSNAHANFSSVVADLLDLNYKASPTSATVLLETTSTKITEVTDAGMPSELKLTIKESKNPTNRDTFSMQWKVTAPGGMKERKMGTLIGAELVRILEDEATISTTIDVKIHD